jgi:hypothetical protein
MNKRIEGDAVEEVVAVVGNNDPGKNSFERGVDPLAYAQLVLANQGPDLNARFKGANIRAALEGQGYDDAAIKKVLKALAL